MLVGFERFVPSFLWCFFLTLFFGYRMFLPTARQGNVFRSVSHSVQRGRRSILWTNTPDRQRPPLTETPLGKRPPWTKTQLERDPLGQKPIWTETPLSGQSDGHCSSQYTSYLNAFLLHGLFSHGVFSHWVFFHGVFSYVVLLHGVFLHGVFSHGVSLHGVFLCGVFLRRVCDK